MWSQRERFIAALFTVQLVGALIFGMVVASSLDDNDGSVVEVAAGAGATGDAGTAGGTGGAGQTGGGQADGSQGAATGQAGDTGSQDGTPTGGDAGTGGAAPGTAGDTATGGSTPGSGGGAGTDPDGGSGDPATSPGGTTPETGGEGTRTGITDNTIKIGVLVTQTGAINFRSSAQATKAYFDALNEQGGIHGRRIEMILRDDNLDKNTGLAAVDEMINAGVFAFVAFNAPNTEQEVVPIVEQHQIPLVGAFAIPSTPMGWIFSAPYETYGVVGGNKLADEGVTTPGLVYLSNNNEETDRIIRESWRSGLAEQGVELRDENIFGVDVTKTSFDDVATQMRFNGVDGIGSILEGTGMKRLQQSLNRAAMSPVHVASPFGGDPAVLNDPNVGSSFEGIFVLSDIAFLGSPEPEQQRYEAEVNARFGGDALIDWAGQYGWLGAKVFHDAMEAIGPDPTRERLVAMINSFSPYENGMTNTLHISEDPLTHNTNNQCMRVGKVVNAQVQQIRDWQCPPLVLSQGGVA